MPYPTCLRTLGVCALFAAAGNFPAHAQEIKTVFVVAMENHNWTQQANQFTGGIQQVYQNPNAPFINSLVNGTAFAVIDGSVVHISEQVAYATAYTNVLATASGNNLHIHPSEPNYIWAEAGTNFGVLNDNDPYTGGTNQNTNQHLVPFLTQARNTCNSYHDNINLPLDPPEPVQRYALHANWRLQRSGWRCCKYQAGRRLPQPDRSRHHGVRRLQEPRRHYPLVG